MQFFPTIGLEIHAELKTDSKMFCGCVNAPDKASVNTHTCPVCLAHPGTLPVINQAAVEQVLRVGTAVNGKIAAFTEFDRKNYFYPDIPKGYQISQYKYPLVSGGKIGPVDITRIHLEEDTARSTHGQSTSLVDFNRAGVPLMELVTEPVIHDAQTAVSFARDLRLLLKYLHASDANLEKGEMRIEANISIAPEGEDLGTKVEVKNLNSFKAVEGAILYEIKRHEEVLTTGGTIVQETRGWDENKQKTFSQRLKEDSHDYRYFPDPDLPKLQLDEIPRFAKVELQRTLPELPWEKRVRYEKLGLHEQQTDLLVSNQALGSLFESTLERLASDSHAPLVANYITSDVVGAVTLADYNGTPAEDLNAEQFAVLIQMIVDKKVSSRGAKDTLQLWLHDQTDPQKLADTHNLLQISDTGALEGTVKKIVDDNASVAQEYRNGKDAALQFLVGQGMKATRGAADPQLLRELLVKELR